MVLERKKGLPKATEGSIQRKHRIGKIHWAWHGASHSILAKDQAPTKTLNCGCCQLTLSACRRGNRKKTRCGPAVEPAIQSKHLGPILRSPSNPLDSLAQNQPEVTGVHDRVFYFVSGFSSVNEVNFWAFSHKFSTKPLEAVVSVVNGVSGARGTLTPWATCLSRACSANTLTE